MGRRVIVYVVLLGVLVATGQAWLVTSMLSRPMANGRSGWDQIRSAARPKQERRMDMPLVEILSVTYRCGDKVFRPPEGIRVEGSVRVRVNGPCPDCYDGEGRPYFNGYVTCPAWESMTFIPAQTSFPAEVDVSIYAGTSATTGYVSWTAEYCGGGTYESGTSSVQVLVDTTTKPYYGSCSPIATDCDPLTLSASVRIYRADSWSYKLYDSQDNEISGGSPNSPDTSGCSFVATVADIPGDSATRIEFSATNTNGTGTASFSLALTTPIITTFEAIPVGIDEGNSATLHWVCEGPPWSVEIDNGVGVVWTSEDGLPCEGTVTVEPTETTTYTITAHGQCSDATFAVTVYVQGVPRPGMASMRWVAQEGIGSRKTAHFTEPAVMNWLAIDPSRTPRTARVVARAAVKEDVRTPQTSRVLARAEARGNRTVRVLCRARCVKPIEVRVLARARSFYPDRYHVKARNVATGIVSEWGVIDANASPLTLTDVSIPAGTYSTWVEREGLFWKDARIGAETLVIVRDGQPPTLLDLPMAVGLAASIAGGLTTLSWDSSSAITDDGMSWGLWFNATSPVTITGEPTLRFLAAIGQTGYEYVVEQFASQYVSVAAIGSDGTRGVAAELYLPWSTIAPTSPANQTASC